LVYKGLYIVYYRTMIVTNIHEAKTHLSEYLDRLEVEGEILLCKRNIPIARIVPVAKETLPFRRVLGDSKLGLSLDEGFWEALDPGLVTAFQGN
jgi:prevent-host-death family protein